MNKLVVITGATRGIGKAIAIKFASNGFDIAACARTDSELKLLARELASLYSINTHIFAADLADKNQVEKFGAFIQNLQLPVEVLVNNAGYFIPGSVLSEAEGSLESMITTNVYSAYNLSRMLVPPMKDLRRGHIFNICSIASFIAYPNGGSYTISKFALLGFSKVLREELKQFGVRVTAIMPGATLTPSWEGAGVPADRLMPASDIAETVFAAYTLSQNAVVEEIVIRPQLGDL